MFLSGTNPISTDTNGNGYTDYNEFYGNYTVDTTVNGAGYSPTDWDGDGYADPVDPAPLSTVNDPDSDGDYVPDSWDSNPYDPAVWADSNNNGINDDAEQPNADTDGDGISDATDSNPSDPWIYNDWNYTGTNDQNEDWDGDGVSNLQDSHPNSNCLWSLLAEIRVKAGQACLPSSWPSWIGLMMGFEQEPALGWNYWRWYYIKRSLWGILGSAGILLALAGLVAWGWVAFVRDVKRSHKLQI